MSVIVSIRKSAVVQVRVFMGLPVVVVFVRMFDVVMIVLKVRVRVRHILMRMFMSVRRSHPCPFVWLRSIRRGPNNSCAFIGPVIEATRPARTMHTHAPIAPLMQITCSKPHCVAAFYSTSDKPATPIPAWRHIGVFWPRLTPICLHVGAVGRG